MLAVKLAELQRMDEGKRNETLDKLVSSATSAPNGQLSRLDAEIRSYETRYEMTSQEMRARFKTGRIDDTAEIATWLLLLQVRERAVK